jgi:hypothetical protein
MIRRPAVVLLGLALLVAPSTLALAHPGDHGTITIEDTVVLGPAGSGDDVFHATISGLGIPFGKGDHLLFDWEELARGQDVEFDIHSHTAAGDSVFYRTYAKQDSGQWVVPADQDYMVYWRNAASSDVAISYKFDLVHPSTADSDPVTPAHVLLLVLPVAAVLGFLILPRSGRAPLESGGPADHEAGENSTGDLRDLEAEAAPDEL